jgi:hypothetical protein
MSFFITRQMDICLTCNREKMAGVNLHENDKEGAFELWIERKYSK